MKKLTLRGTFIEGDVVRLVVDDGRFTTGYRVTAFKCSTNVSLSSEDGFATLSLKYDAPLNWDWSDARQIGWASIYVSQSSGVGYEYSHIDPEHVVVRDLFIQGQVSSAGGGQRINYWVELEEVELEPYQAVVALIKEESQSVGRQ